MEFLRFALFWRLHKIDPRSDDFGFIFRDFCSKIDLNSSKNRPWRLQNQPRRLPNQPRRLQNRPRGAPEGPKEAKTQSVAPILGVLRVTLGPRNLPKIDKKPLFAVTFFACVFLPCFHVFLTLLRRFGSILGRAESHLDM